MTWNDELPYNHSGRWIKKLPSIMHPGSKVTWPQLVAEYIIFFRIKFIDNYKDIKTGENWHKPIMKQVRNLNQQSAVICNYFPHPDDEPLVYAAVKNWFRKFKPMKIGQFRKNRKSITQDEKDVVLGIESELERLTHQRNVLVENITPTITPEDKIRYNGGIKSTQNKGNLRQILDLEEKIKNGKN